MRIMKKIIHLETLSILVALPCTQYPSLCCMREGGRGLMYGPSLPMDMTGADGLGAKYLGVIEQLAVPLGGIVLLSGNAFLGDVDALGEVGQLD